MSSVEKQDCEYDFVGRENELGDLREKIQDGKHRLIWIYGMPQVGKSRVARQLYSEIKRSDQFDLSVYVECKVRDRIDSEDHLLRFLEKLYSSCGMVFTHDSIETAVTAFVQDLEKRGKTIFLFIDNAETALCSPIGSDFLSLISALVKHSNGRATVMVTSSDLKRVPTIKSQVVYEMPFMSQQDTEALLLSVIDSIDREIDLGIFLPFVAKACEGLPVLTFIAAERLTEDGGFLEPAEFLELVITDRLNCLSPEFCVQEDRMDNYTTELRKLHDQLQSWFRQVDQLFSGVELNMQDAVEAASSKGTKATVKDQIILPLRHKGFVKLLKGNRTLEIPLVIRECISNLQRLKNSEEEIQESCGDVQKTLKDRMSLECEHLGLYVSESDLANFIDDPQSLEERLTLLKRGTTQLPDDNLITSSTDSLHSETETKINNLDCVTSTTHDPLHESEMNILYSRSMTDSHVDSGPEAMSYRCPD